MAKLPDGLKLKDQQFEKLAGLWSLAKEKLKNSEGSLNHFSVTELETQRLRVDVFGFSYLLVFSHNFQFGRILYAQWDDQGNLGDGLLSVAFDPKGKLGEPYSKYTVKDFAEVNFLILDSITSISRIKR
ncbi:MAG: hypothetical protein OEZ68_10795 [Gammaproteobacteria bacterium]|nr:hypothetical protein [Gammaproteobacteria bacterium]MDH5801280.1 hypothetical protein [Gammaproteobacteria bacterium]